MIETNEILGSTETRGLPSRIVARVRRDVPLALLDAAVVVPAYLVPLVLRFNGGVPSKNWRYFWVLLPAIVLIHLLSNYLFGLYGQMWRYASVQEARRVVLSGLTSFVLVLGLDLLVGRGGERPTPALRGRARERGGDDGLRRDPVPESPLRVPAPVRRADRWDPGPADGCGGRRRPGAERHPPPPRARPPGRRIGRRRSAEPRARAPRRDGAGRAVRDPGARAASSARTRCCWRSRAPRAT